MLLFQWHKLKTLNLIIHLFDENSHESILVYDKSLISAKPLRISFNKVDGVITVYDGTKYLVIFGDEKYDFIYNRIKCLVDEKGYYICFFS